MFDYPPLVQIFQHDFSASSEASSEIRAKRGISIMIGKTVYPKG